MVHLHAHAAGALAAQILTGSSYIVCMFLHAAGGKLKDLGRQGWELGPCMTSIIVYAQRHASASLAKCCILCLHMP